MVPSPTIQGGNEGIFQLRFLPEIETRNFTFACENRDPLDLNDVSLSTAKGEFALLAGRSDSKWAVVRNR